MYADLNQELSVMDITIHTTFTQFVYTQQDLSGK